MAERRERGNTPKAKPPRSSLSNSRSSTEIEVDREWVEKMLQDELREELEREALRVREEVGYLYFVGPVHVVEGWKDDYLQGNGQLVVRMTMPQSETSGSDTGGEENGDGDGDGDKENVDEMDMDWSWGAERCSWALL